MAKGTGKKTTTLKLFIYLFLFFFFQAEDGIRDIGVTGVQTCALPNLYFMSYLQNPQGAYIPPPPCGLGLRDTDRKSVVQGKRVDLGGRRTIKKKKQKIIIIIFIIIIF